MTKFYELSTEQRLQQLYQAGYLSAADLKLLTPSQGLPTEIASHLVENQIGAFGVPLGLAQNFVIDGKSYLVPLATEEPSVIAAASNAAKRCQQAGGFQTKVRREGLNGQIVFMGQLAHAEQFLAQHLAQIKAVATKAHPSLEQHGGGFKQITVRQVGEFVEFLLLIDPAQAMGANVVNTLTEAVAHYLATQLPQLELLMAILSNQVPNQRVQVQAQFTFAELATKKMAGQQVAKKIVAASQFAQLSSSRAATHNKGTMNGMNAVVLATGNDTRNLNAAAYADLTDRHPTWTQWQITDDQLVGTIELPLPLGQVGGAISTLPLAQLSLKILQQPSAKQLMSIVASVGLASNLAALRALVTRGIQAGHMNLQLQSLALMAGANGAELEAVVAQLRKQPQQANLSLAQAILQHLREN
ncbi:hydroxymethylglutaryl-CoA reductase, degradative [Bombilactobacillus folatiphilus]|uniref:3-hydroxy-3-methylglutaryl coenzyme A reductase n=1 Tax=Bombilactobacillus folatiphilus TaxID=2923362 RepID=A0ABY4P7S0_9LACO|nr:hydroxymethylglutaryl-CoA reductase, degradative [Bombilactobacillus folatiphilus]UQS81755.1 hydroxymethylglutaryl-CoA reductase, degradative [Bombilactobacillus folatiphilus]